MEPRKPVNYRDALKEERKARSKTFRNGGSTAVRIPREFNLDASEVMISETPAGILITPVALPVSIDEWWGTWDAMPDFMEGGRNQPAPQVRNFDY